MLYVIQGSFNQDHPMFGESSGKQCPCCSLYAITLTIVDHLVIVIKDDVDFVVREGDRLHKSLNKNTYISVPYLPPFIAMFGSNVRISYLEHSACWNCIAILWTKNNLFVF